MWCWNRCDRPGKEECTALFGHLEQWRVGGRLKRCTEVRWMEEVVGNWEEDGTIREGSAICMGEGGLQWKVWRRQDSTRWRSFWDDPDMTAGNGQTDRQTATMTQHSTCSFTTSRSLIQTKYVQGRDDIKNVPWLSSGSWHIREKDGTTIYYTIFFYSEYSSLFSTVWNLFSSIDMYKD